MRAAVLMIVSLAVLASFGGGPSESMPEHWRHEFDQPAIEMGGQEVCVVGSIDHIEGATRVAAASHKPQARTASFRRLPAWEPPAASHWVPAGTCTSQIKAGSAFGVWREACRGSPLATL